MPEKIPAELKDMQRLASVAQVGGFRPPSTPRSSWIGSVLLGAPDEGWPEANGRPMWPLCQILTEELPAAAPTPLTDVALLTLFMDLIEVPYEQPHGEGWELRTYATTDGLVPLLEPEREVSERSPEEDLQVRPFPVVWRPRIELPSRDETPLELTDAWDEMAGELDTEQLHLDGLKVGGWPRTIQTEVDWSVNGKGRIDDVQFVLQVDSDEKSQIVIVDAGAAYVGWSPSQGWVLSWQCY